VSEVKSLLSKAGLVTLTGTGGVGKTRLAVEVAGKLANSYRDGVWLVELASLRDSDVVPQVVVSTLGLREQPGRSLTETLTDYLQTCQLLLVLDNCEHVIGAAAQLISLLLRTCPDLQILATSREALSIGGEIAWRVPSLSLPTAERLLANEGWADNDSMALFVDRAAAALGAFQLDDKNGPVVLQVCQRLDGIPLAIELAVGKLKVLSLGQIADRLNDRFHLLTGGSRTALPRQQTLAAAIDWSYDLLPETEQAVLRRSSVFAGGFDLEAAEAVCTGGVCEAAQVLDVLARLIDKSLLQAARKEEVRYRLLETIRQYADTKLHQAGDIADVRERHRDWFMALAERAQQELRGPHQVMWYARLETELDNIRAAFEWSMDQQQTDVAMRLACALGHFWRLAEHTTEGRARLARVLGGPVPGAPAMRARAAAWGALLAGDQHDNESGRRLAEESLSLFHATGDQQGVGFALLALGNQSMGFNDPKTASRLYEESLHHFRLSETKPDIAWALGKLGYMAWALGDYDNAIRHLTESRDLYEEIGDRVGVGFTLQDLGQVAISKGDWTLATHFLQDSLAPMRQINDVYNACYSLYLQAIVARCEKDYPHASALLEESVLPLREPGDKMLASYCRREQGVLASLEGNVSNATTLLRLAATTSLELGDKWNLAKCFEALGGICSEAGELRSAANLFGAAEALRDEIDSAIEPYERPAYLAQVTAVRARLGSAELQKAWATGRATPIEKVIPTFLKVD
jgi:predicted ATPase